MKFNPGMKSKKKDVQTLFPKMKLNDEQIFFPFEALHNDFCIMFEHNKCNMKQYVLKKEAIEKDF